VTDHANLRTGYLVKRVELLVRTRLDTALGDLGLTTGQYAALSLLASMPNASSAQLARAIGVTPQTMAETILAFERDDLIRRTPSSEHKRVLEITLTAKGTALQKKCEKRVSQVEGELFAALSTDEVGQFRSHLLAILHIGDGERL